MVSSLERMTKCDFWHLLPGSVVGVLFPSPSQSMQESLHLYKLSGHGRLECNQKLHFACAIRLYAYEWHAFVIEHCASCWIANDVTQTLQLLHDLEKNIQRLQDNWDSNAHKILPCRCAFIVQWPLRILTINVHTNWQSCTMQASWARFVHPLLWLIPCKYCTT